MEISVVIPAFNEENVIEDTIEQVKDFLANNFRSFEIIIVDDKSSDSTLDIIQTITGIKVLRNLRNHGKGYSVAKGMKSAQGKRLLFMDADNSTNIKELKNFLPQTKDYDLVIASRSLKDSNIELRQNFIKSFLGKIGNIFSRTLVDKNIRDTQCGFKLFTSDVQYLFDKLTIPGFAFDFELIFLAKKYRLRVKEMPITWVNNFDSTVKWHDYPRTMFNLVIIRINNLLGKYD